MGKVIRLTESELIQIIKRVIIENKNPEWVHSLERTLNKNIDINRDRPFVNSPQASVYFDGKYVSIEIMYDKFMEESDGVGILLNKIVSSTMEEVGEEFGIDFKFKSSNLEKYISSKHAEDEYGGRDFRDDNYSLKFRYEISER